MIRHMVFWKLARPAAAQQALDEIRPALEGLVGVVPGLLQAKVSRACAGWDLVLDTAFTDRAALAAYQLHPAHLAAKRVVHSHIADRTAADWEA